MKKIISRIPPENAAEVHLHPLLNRIYVTRGVKTPAELNHELSGLLPYHGLTGINQAVECLVSALKEQKRILVVGDFDVDGATSTVLAMLGLKSFGFKNVSYLIPNRFEYGYGLTPEIVAVAAKDDPQLIVTVDNGISSVDGVKAANALGIQVLITDHHLPDSVLPDACAIVNPNQNGDQFASKNLAGVGVIFYLMLALRAHLREINWFEIQKIQAPNMADLLDLVALGTVADVVSLDHNNRILVTQGIKRIRLGKCRVGMLELIAVSKRNFTNVTAANLGFVVAPRLNASGRLDDMSLGIECLLTEDVVRARTIAKQLDALNNERREIEEDMRRQATRALDDLQLGNELPAGLCVFEETWHQGVLGILASRLKDKLHRPVIAFTAVNDTELKGSARSTDSVHIRNVLSDMAQQNPGLIKKFGGHAMAAGLSLMRENYEMFSQIFAEKVGKNITAEDLAGVIRTDGELAGEYLNLDTAELLQVSGPWGSDFFEPTFFGEFALIDQRLVGQKHLKLTLRNLEDNKEIDAIYFNVNPNVWPNFRLAKAKMVYKLGVNEYNGRKKLQLMVEDIIL